ncbi:contact-dependent growth inhibition system immunity protein [Flavobacteriales bacterium]|jgi:hypothetical protein|nr:contact-dependent growth inhibition system immunity protein [Flavobacteriales bacterium]
MKLNFENNWLQKSLESLEKKIWPSVNYEEESYLVGTCNKLRKIQLKDFEVEDLRIMIGQDIGLKFLLPLAIEKLNEDILVEGDYYPGDLLSAVLSSDKDFWKENSDYKNEVLVVLETQSERIKNEDVSFEMKRDWYEMIEAFKKL